MAGAAATRKSEPVAAVSPRRVGCYVTGSVTLAAPRGGMPVFGIRSTDGAGTLDQARGDRRAEAVLGLLLRGRDGNGGGLPLSHGTPGDQDPESAGLVKWGSDRVRSGGGV